MTQAQRSKAFEIAESLDYTGYLDVRVNALGAWISPASTAMTDNMQDSLVFVWSRERDDFGAMGSAYRIRERGDD